MMAHTLLGIFFILHGLVHLWYFVLARQLVPFKEDMGWSGKSWLFTPLIGDGATRRLESLLLVLTTAAFVTGASGYLAAQAWAVPLLLAAAGVSILDFGLFWDGGLKYIVQKGLLGILIEAGILLGLLTF